AVFDKMIGNMQEAKARGASVIALTTPGDQKLRAILDPLRDVVIEVPRGPELLTPIVMVLPLQLLAYDIAVRRGCDVDQPRNLAKSVTVEQVGLVASGRATMLRSALVTSHQPRHAFFRRPQSPTTG